MDTTQFVRDPDRLYRALAKTNQQLIAKEPLRIYIPVRFAEKKLAYVGSDTYIVGIYMIATEDDRYAISSVDAMMQIDPTNVTKVKMQDTEYYEFYFRKGAVVVKNLNLVKNNKLIYDIFNEMITKGKAPWYLNYLDYSKILSSAKKYAGVNVGENHEVMELLASMLARQPDDKTKYYRTMVKTKAEVLSKQPALIALRSVQYSATNTVNKLAGSYFRPALISALNNPSERVTRLDRILTS